jgi:hypothetical protein
VIGAVVVVVIVLLWAFAFGGISSGGGSASASSGCSGPHSSSSFDFSCNLPTGNLNSNGAHRCGANVTVNISGPAHETLWYDMSVNTSGGSVNVWDGVAGTIYGYVFLAYTGTEYQEWPFGDTGGTVEFYLQGCGSMPSVFLGFWGDYSPTSS